jgi:hypothetical protein
MLRQFPDRWRRWLEDDAGFRHLDAGIIAIHRMGQRQTLGEGWLEVLPQLDTCPKLPAQVIAFGAVSACSR